MWDTICIGLEPQPLPYNITHAQPYPKFLKIPPPPAHEGNSVRGNPYAHPQHSKILKCILFKYDKDVGCCIHEFGASAITLPHQLTQPYPKFPKILPHIHKGITVKGGIHMPIHSIARC